MNDANTAPRALPTGSGDDPAGADPVGTGTTGPDGPPVRLFRRSREDQMIAGVCGGAGRVLGVDPVLVRLAMAALALFGVGLGALLYLICWVIVPLEEPAADPAPPTSPAG